MRDDVARVLVVDDDDLLVDELRRLLVADGYSVTTAMQRSEALQALAEADWQVVVLDLKLEGPLGPDHGLELIADVRLRAPAARIVLLTAYATPSNIERAFAEGIYDFIQKEGPFGFLLRAKVRRAIDAERDRRLLALQSDERERRLGEVWQATQTEADPHRKGALLEETVVLLFQTLPGLHRTSNNRRNELEEIDVLVRNESNDAFWQRQSDYLLVECKHWSKPVGVEAYRSLLHKMERRYDRCELGFLIALGGFTGSLRADVLTERRGKSLVLLIDQSGLQALISDAPEHRLEHLKRLLDRAIVDANGKH